MGHERSVEDCEEFVKGLPRRKHPQGEGTQALGLHGALLIQRARSAHLNATPSTSLLTHPSTTLHRLSTAITSSPTQVMQGLSFVSSEREETRSSATGRT